MVRVDAKAGAACRQLDDDRDGLVFIYSLKSILRHRGAMVACPPPITIGSSAGGLGFESLLCHILLVHSRIPDKF